LDKKVETAAESMFAFLAANVTKREGTGTRKQELDKCGKSNLHKKVRALNVSQFSGTATPGC